MAWHIGKAEVIRTIAILHVGGFLGELIADWVAPHATGSGETNWQVLAIGALLGTTLAAFVLRGSEKIKDEIQEEAELRHNRQSGLAASQLLERVITRANAQPLNIEGLSRCAFRLISLVHESPHDTGCNRLPHAIARLGEGALALPDSDTPSARRDYKEDLHVLTGIVQLLHKNHGVSKALCLQALHSLKDIILSRVSNQHPAISRFLSESIEAEILKLQDIRGGTVDAATTPRPQ